MPILQDLIRKALSLGFPDVNWPTISPFKRAKLLYELKVLLARYVKDAFLITAGVFTAGLGLKGFLLPNQFIDGGAVGIALLIAEVSKTPLWILLLLVNAPFMWMAYRNIGRVFAIKTILAIVMLSAVAGLVAFPVVTQEKLLVAVFGGFFVGAGIGLAVRGGAVIDGTEVLALSVSKRSGLTIGDVILLLNIVIFSVAAWLLTVETALYSLLAYLSAAKAVDFFVEGVEEYIGVTIVSHKSTEIKRRIVDELKRGVTVYAGKKGIGKSGAQHDMDILFTVITRLEIGRLRTEVDRIDPNAFIVMQSVKDTIGGMVKARPLKH